VSYLDRIATLHRWSPGAYRPFTIDGVRVGRIHDTVVRLLSDFPETFRVTQREVALAGPAGDLDGRSARVHEVLDRLSERGDIRPLRGETYGVSESWQAPVRLRMDRGAVPTFGVKSYGVHVNGFLRADDGLRMWIARRAPDKRIAPGKLDHMVAGGLAHGYSAAETLVKEAAEEADVPAALARTARPVGALTYVTEIEGGLRDDALFLYDLELPADFEPRNTDGELSGFELWPVDRLMAEVRDTEAFKFNVAPVLIDFFLRHGLLDPDHEPDYLALVTGLGGAGGV
jgi:8-oxo-dGTP pyrophosphatase MutT (NUDIX family)